MVFLSGDRAYKLKRAVKFPYMDFSTAARRRAMCDAEIEINRRLAPEIYLGVEPARQRLAGRDAPLRRGRDARPMAERGALTPALMAALGARIARYHEGWRRSATARPARRLPPFGRCRHPSDARTGRPSRSGDQRGAGREDAAGAGAVIDLVARRVEAGAIRRCHGDLHLRNIVLIDGKPVPFDAIEFSERIANIDVLYDLSFALMDLCERKLQAARQPAAQRMDLAIDELPGARITRRWRCCRCSCRAAPRSAPLSIPAAAVSDGDTAVRATTSRSRCPSCSPRRRG